MSPSASKYFWDDSYSLLRILVLLVHVVLKNVLLGKNYFLIYALSPVPVLAVKYWLLPVHNNEPCKSQALFCSITTEKPANKP